MAEPLKNRYHQTFFDNLISDFKTEKSDFNEEAFKTKIFDSNWEARELKDRMRHIAMTLNNVLGLPYPSTLELFKKVIKMRSGMGLEYMFFPDFVEVFGLEDLENSLDALEAFTEYASSEFAIRPFILKYEKKTMNRMNKWSKHENHHIRRLASEGCRPRLPWAMALPKYKKDPSTVIPILERLKNDESEYVRRSVANNLNDISKDHPGLVLEIGQKWIGKTAETDWVVKHASRGLLKKGNTQALMLFGFGNPKNIEIQNLELSPNPVKIGDYLNFNFDLKNNATEAAKLRLEYGIDFVKKTGKTSKKVFKITENNYENGVKSIQRKQSFQDFTTRTHYPGTHRLSIIVNGIEKASLEFEVIR